MACTAVAVGDVALPGFAAHQFGGGLAALSPLRSKRRCDAHRGRAVALLPCPMPCPAPVTTAMPISCPLVFEDRSGVSTSPRIWVPQHPRTVHAVALGCVANRRSIRWRNGLGRYPDHLAGDRTDARAIGRGPSHSSPEHPGDGGDSPAWSRKRAAYEPRPGHRTALAPVVPYAELHCHSNFSFLDGASHAEELVEEAVRLGLEALALTDHNGFYGVVRFAEAARAHGLPTVFGAELTLGSRQPPPRPARPCRGAPARARPQSRGYARLGWAISRAQMAGERGRRAIALPELTDIGAGGDAWVVLTACRKGTVPAALERDGPRAARRALDELVARFGRGQCRGRVVGSRASARLGPQRRARASWRSMPASRSSPPTTCTTTVRRGASWPQRWRQCALAVRSTRSTDGCPPRAPRICVRVRSRPLGSPATRAWSSAPPSSAGPARSTSRWWRPTCRRSRARPVTTRCRGCAKSPSRGAASATALARAERVPGAYRQIDHELALIEQLGFPGYFLVVWDIVEFCRRRNIFCQGRGSAANSAVCYALGITNADAVDLGLLFERFMSPERDGPPDIDIDIESDRREEAIQYVYDKHGRDHAAQVANVITYRARSSVRDMAKALGYATGQQDAFSKSIDRWAGLGDKCGEAHAGSGECRQRAGFDDRQGSDTVPAAVVELAPEIEHFPRHLGIHSGGMVICDRPVIEVCPVEWGRMENRSVLQWDKDDCAAVGLVKFDLLGSRHALGVALRHRFHRVIITGSTSTSPTIPQEDVIYDMLCAADSIGVFQVESRAQMATLPRLRPRTFYDLVVEVALIRPGPIQGGSVHPYIRRRNGEEPVTYLHPLLENSLAKTLGIPLFQEQLMQMAIDVAGFTASEADQLRQAMGSKRSRERMERLQQRFAVGATRARCPRDIIEQIWDKLAAFANYGFPESHSVSFAYLGLREFVDQVPLSRGVLCGVAQRATDGVLFAALAGARRPPSWCRGAHPVRQRIGGKGHTPTVRVVAQRCSGAPRYRIRP